MSLWKIKTTVEQLRERSKNTLMEHLGIEYLELGDDFLTARMPVDHRTQQTEGILHGGASVVLAETLGSIAARLCLGSEDKTVVGLEINANHIRPVRSGWVTGTARPVHMGIKTQIWEIRITNDQDKLVCISRLTIANIDV
jgi:1,4-dihydroxy-2-naphthoyl-CoA hydrolase